MSFVALSTYPAPAFHPRRYGHPRRRGMGATTAQIAGSAVTGGFDIAGAALAMTGVGAPIGAIVAAIGSILGPIVASFNGCGQTCVQATAIVNQAGPLIQQAFDLYMQQPVHYKSVQAAFLSQFDQIWAAVDQALSNPALGTAGQNGIASFGPQACYFKASPGSWNQVNGVWTWTTFGPRGSGSGCFNWFTAYRDPVANDPTVVPDPSPLASVGSSVSSLLSGATSGNILPLLMIGGGLLLVLVVAQQL